MSEIVIIGGITADIEGHPYQRLVYADSNPGKISISYGGVGRNIAENLGRMGASVSFHSVAGDDLTGRGAIRELSDLGVDVSGVKLIPGQNTAMYMSILNLVGDMELALCNMDALERITPDLIDHAAFSDENAKVIALDTNLNEETLDYTVRRLGGKPLFLDPVSTIKAERARSLIGKFDIIKPNRVEAEILSGMEIRDPQGLETAGKWFLDQGVKRVFITLSAGGVYYRDEKVSGIVTPTHSLAGTGSATGAGDAFSAGVLYSYVKGFDMIETVNFAMSAASIAMEAKAAVNPMMSKGEIERRLP
jgi:pseudouridine kinase